MDPDKVRTIDGILTDTYEYTLAQRAAIELHKAGITAKQLHEFTTRTEVGKTIPSPQTNNTYNELLDIERRLADARET